MSDTTPPEGVISAEGVVSASSDAEGIVIVRIFDAPREEVFKAWTVAERFATWFGEHGSSIPLDKVSMDARPGGAWHATMLHGPEQVQLEFFGHFREVVEPERVVMTLGDPDGADAEVLTVVLADLGGDRTEMTFSQRGGNLQADDNSRALRGYLIFFDRIAEHLADSLKARHDSDQDAGGPPSTDVTG